ncbi:MAG: hypothetical protein ACKO0Z_28680 [Betaproteobacteria bacterium]
MALTTNTQSNAMSVANHAVGMIVTDAGAAADTTIQLGFVPRVVRFHNITDRISDEWYEGMSAYNAIHTVAAGTRTLETTNGISVNASGNSFTVKAATIPASKTFVWEAVG